MADWADYFAKSRPPSNLDEAKRTIQDFALKHRQFGRNIVLVTSGGTTVPIESNTVRFLDNFSQGTRGACSAEYFLMQGYAVIFLHRQRSFEPFCRHFEGHNALDLLDLHLDGNGVCRVAVDDSRAPGLQDIVRRYKEVQSGCLLLKIGFMTLSDYLFLLRASADALSPLGPNVMFYLAAAVSDFYIPESEMEQHKIQSSEGALNLRMQPTPKLLSPLVKEWAKHAFVVSFKLETDVNIISRKAREALQKYNHQVVIANILQTRRKTVVMVTPYEEVPIWMSEHELELGKEIEEKIVAELSRRHLQLIGGASDLSSGAQVVNSHIAFSPAQYHNQNSLAASMTSSMPGLAPINVYSATPLGGKASAVSGVLLHLKTPDGTSSGPHLMTPSILKRSLSAREDSSGLSIDMQNFINDFKARRIALGYTQDDVGREMSVLNGPTYSQSFISRFEGKQLGMKAAERMRPILDAWILSKEEEFHRGSKFAKKRRKRTSFSPDLLEVLVDYFNKNQKPTPEELLMIAQKTALDVTTVKVWFCNKKQSLKRAGQPVQDNTLRAEIDAKRKLKSEDELNDNVFAFAQSASLKTYVPVSTPAGAVTVPFFVNQDGSSIAIVSAGTAANQSGVQTNLSADDNGDHMATTLSQHVILSNVNMLPSMAVVDNALQPPASIALQGASQSHSLVDGSRLLLGGTALHHIQGLTRSMAEPNCALNDNDDLEAESRSHVSRNKGRGVGSLSGMLEGVHSETSLSSGCIANSGCDVSGMATDSVILPSDDNNLDLRQKAETRSKKSFVSKQKQNYAAAAAKSNSDEDRNDPVLE